MRLEKSRVKYDLISSSHLLFIKKQLSNATVHKLNANTTNTFKARPDDLRKFSFTNRVVNIWNSLPNWVVSANT